MADGTYMKVDVSEESKNQLKSFFKEIGIDDIKQDLHVTLIYSRKVVEIDDVLADKIYIAFPKQYNLFTCDGKQDLLVLEIHSNSLVNRHESIMQKTGATYDYDEYKPHISIKGNFLNNSIKDLPLPNFPILLEGEVVEDLID